MSDDEFQNLMQSPYGADDGGDDEIPWKPPVVAAILGALLMGAYVIFAVVTGPSEESEVAGTTPDGEPFDIVQDEFPVGYAAVSSDVALRADVMSVNNNGTTVYMSSVVRAGAEAVAPVDVATWSLLLPDRGPTIGVATQNLLSPGGTTIQFESTPDTTATVLLASLPGSVVTSSTVTSIGSVPFRLVNREIVGDGFVIVIDELSLGPNGGSFRWHLADGVVAKVDVVVSLDLGGPVGVFTTPYNPANHQVATVALPPAWATAGRSQLIPNFDSRGEAAHGVATGATIEFLVEVVTELGETFEIPVVIVVQR